VISGARALECARLVALECARLVGCRPAEAFALSFVGHRVHDPEAMRGPGEEAVAIAQETGEPWS